jgi:general secretion pathway protein G
MNSNTAPSPPPAVTPRTSGLAIASLVLGILSFGFWIITGLPAVICGHLSLSKIKKAPQTLGGRGLAIAGLITGYIGLAFGTLIFCLSIASLGKNVEQARHFKVAADIRAIKTELAMYQNMDGVYPTTQQGLQALVTEPGMDPKPERWMRLLEELPKDPWHNDYIYLCPGHKNPDSYDLYSAGPDHKPDTADDDWGE